MPRHSRCMCLAPLYRWCLSVSPLKYRSSSSIHVYHQGWLAPAASFVVSCLPLRLFHAVRFYIYMHACGSESQTVRWWRPSGRPDLMLDRWPCACSPRLLPVPAGCRSSRPPGPQVKRTCFILYCLAGLPLAVFLVCPPTPQAGSLLMHPPFTIPVI